MIAGEEHHPVAQGPERGDRVGGIAPGHVTQPDGGPAARVVGEPHEPRPPALQPPAPAILHRAVDIDDATGLAKAVWAVRVGPHLSQAVPEAWIS